MSFLYIVVSLYFVILSDKLVLLRFFQIMFQKGRYHSEQFITDGFVEANMVSPIEKNYVCTW